MVLYSHTLVHTSRGSSLNYLGQSNHSSSTMPPQIELGYKGCYVCNEVEHLVKDYPECMHVPTH